MADNHRDYDGFVDRLVRGEIPTATTEELDALLHWLVGRDVASAKAIQAGFERHGTSPARAQNVTLLYLDATLFSHESDPYRLFGLVPGCDFTDIRDRHKRLLQVFHPDRHADNKTWFTERSERINNAYSYLKQYHGTPSRPSPVRSTVTPAPEGARSVKRNSPQRHRRRPVWVDKKHMRRRLRESLGNATKLQQRLFIALFSLPVVLLLVLYVNNKGNVESSGFSGNGNVEREPEARAAAEADGAAASSPPEEVALVSRKDDRPVGSTEDESTPAVEDEDGGPDDGMRNEADSLSLETAPSSGQTDIESERIDTGGESDAKAVAQRIRENPTPGPAAIGDDAPADGPSDPLTPSAGGQDGDDLLAQSQPIDEPEDESAASQESEPDTENNDAAPKKEEADDTRKEEAVEIVSSEDQGADSGTNLQEENNRADDRENSEKTTVSSINEPAGSDDNSTVENSSPEGEVAGWEDEPEADSAGPESTQTDIARLIPEAEEPPNDIALIRALLETYQNTYNDSDTGRFADLFAQEAQTVEAKGKPTIKKKYKEFFDGTRSRNLVLDNVRITLLGDRQFTVNTHYTATWTYSNGRSEERSGSLVFHLIPAGKDLKIWRLKY